jgi:hypothetical protein
MAVRTDIDYETFPSSAMADGTIAAIATNALVSRRPRPRFPELEPKPRERAELDTAAEDRDVTREWQAYVGREIRGAVKQIGQGLGEVLRDELDAIAAAFRKRDEKISKLEVELARSQADVARLHERVAGWRSIASASAAGSLICRRSREPARSIDCFSRPDPPWGDGPGLPRRCHGGRHRMSMGFISPKCRAVLRLAQAAVRARENAQRQIFGADAGFG